VVNGLALLDVFGFNSRRNSLRLVLVGLLAPTCAGLDAHKNMTQYVQTSLTDRTGLPQNSVNSVTQTSDGYLWFGTQEGLARYDGLNVKVFDSLKFKALKDSFINTIASARDGSLWIGTRTGLIRYKNGTFHTYLAAQSPISKIYESSSGQIWVGSLNGLHVIEGETVHSYTKEDGLPDNSITSIVQTTDGTLWFGTAKGLASWKNGSFRRYTAREGISTDPILTLAISHDDSLWVATASGLLRWKGKPLERVAQSSMPLHARITYLLENRRRTLWIAFDHSGIASFQGGELVRYTTHEGLPSDDVTQVFEDREEHLWIAMLGGGVAELRKGSFSSFGEREGLSENMVWSVLQARDGSVWVGTNSKGLNHISNNGEVHVYSTHDGLPSGSIFALLEADDGSMWIGMEHGELCHLRNGRITVFRDLLSKGAQLRSILRVSNDNLLLGFHETNGLVRFHHGHFQHSLLSGLVNATALAPDGSIWVATDHGGAAHIQNGSVTSYTTQNGMLSNFAQAVYVDKDAVAWVGTSPGGLNRIKNGHVTTYSVDQGLFDLTVGAIVEDDFGYLWMTCDRGIYKISKKELNDYADGRISTVHSIVYGLADGLRSVECNFGTDPSVWKGGDGRVWFATTAGITSIDPNRSQIAISKSGVLIEDALLSQKPTAFDHGITAPPGSGNVEIRFTAPNFVDPERLRFRYRLRGFDSDWVEAGERREAYYTKVPPGLYLFEVEAANGDVGWVSAAARLDLTLLPYFWQTRWFRALCGLTLLLICVAIYRMRVRYLLERNLQLEEKVTQRTAELQEAMKVTEAAHFALHEQATKDALTSLWNRRAVVDMLNSEAERAHRDDRPICILMADVDHFKLVNDTYGHLTGDRVLQEVAGRIAKLTRTYDFAGRYGGEEFLIVLPGCSLTDGLNRAEEFRYAIANAPISFGHESLRVTCSFGVAEYSTRITVEELINEADEALYYSKRTGRDRAHAPGLLDQSYRLKS
jgi:diguanylate cyclase (GGDEF)-like protein